MALPIPFRVFRASKVPFIIGLGAGDFEVALIFDDFKHLNIDRKKNNDFFSSLYFLSTVYVYILIISKDFVLKEVQVSCMILHASGL